MAAKNNRPSVSLGVPHSDGSVVNGGGEMCPVGAEVDLCGAARARAQGHELTPCVGVEKVHGSVGVRGGDTCAVRANGDAKNRRGRNIGCPQLVSRNDVPDADFLIVARRHNAFPIGTEYGVSWATSMSAKCPDFFATSHVPKPDRPVVAGGDKLLTVGTVGDAVQAAIMPSQRCSSLVGIGVPQLDGSIP